MSHVTEHSLTPLAASRSKPEDLQALSGEVVDLFYTQTFAVGSPPSEAGVCRAFSKLLLRHWELDCIMTFLPTADGRLSETAVVHLNEQVDDAATRRAARLLAASVEGTKHEEQIWIDEELSVVGADAEVQSAFQKAHLRAGIGVPVSANGELVGLLVVLTRRGNKLFDALDGIHFIAAPIVIAVSNARRAQQAGEQKHHITQLVEELQQRQDELESANQELRRMARYRSLFLGRMSHELRTPLTAVLGFAEILLDQEELSGSVRNYCERIQASGLQLQTSLNQLVDLSRLEAGRTELFLHEFSVREVMREACAAAERLADRQDVRLECQVAEALGLIVSDEGKLRQILYNLLAYAISRSPAGSQVRLKAETPEADFVRIKIDDEGETRIDTRFIFDPIEREASGEQNSNINELGVVIAHRLVSLLEGRIAFENREAGGLCVQLDLPMQRAGQH